MLCVLHEESVMSLESYIRL